MCVWVCVCVFVRACVRACVCMFNYLFTAMHNIIKQSLYVPYLQLWLTMRKSTKIYYKYQSRTIKHSITQQVKQCSI